MLKFKTYDTPKDYLEDTESFLEEKELENNIILGNCYKFAGKKTQTEFNFVNCFKDDRIKISSMLINSRLIISCNTGQATIIKHLAEYYTEQNIFVNGVMGLKKNTEVFSERFCAGKNFTRNLLLHSLKEVNKLKHGDGVFEKAEFKDSGIISEMIYDFTNETNTLRGKTRENISDETEFLIQNNSVFKWICKNKIVCISTLMRKTKNFGIVGLVYTPPEFRGNGFASGCVLKLSEYILRSGFKGSGLYTDILNPISNSIYKKIGYRKISEFTDIKFL